MDAGTVESISTYVVIMAIKEWRSQCWSLFLESFGTHHVEGICKESLIIWLTPSIFFRRCCFFLTFSQVLSLDINEACLPFFTQRTVSAFVRLPRAQPIETSIEATGRLPIKNLKKTADKFNKRNIKYVRAWFPLSNNVNSVHCVLILFDQKSLVLRRQSRTGGWHLKSHAGLQAGFL